MRISDDALMYIHLCGVIWGCWQLSLITHRPLSPGSGGVRPPAGRSNRTDCDLRKALLLLHLTEGLEPQNIKCPTLILHRSGPDDSLLARAMTMSEPTA
ncbi:hypothetical protein EVAR_3644_1 [Eumeta japonica]|uniref:Uncharacterized protein n=1 Tax=Eumeta variegata TaxID=151549 RepID=A0A4C1SYS2_EUMVA|nr:hypothetical protein EVAR_3644_1 [Eumeta japonica]